MAYEICFMATINNTQADCYHWQGCPSYPPPIDVSLSMDHKRDSSASMNRKKPYWSLEMIVSSCLDMEDAYCVGKSMDEGEEYIRRNLCNCMSALMHDNHNHLILWYSKRNQQILWASSIKLYFLDGNPITIMKTKNLRELYVLLMS